jgi:hypothetical protein
MKLGSKEDLLAGKEVEAEVEGQTRGKMGFKGRSRSVKDQPSFQEKINSFYHLMECQI